MTEPKPLTRLEGCWVPATFNRNVADKAEDNQLPKGNNPWKRVYHADVVDEKLQSALQGLLNKKFCNACGQSECEDTNLMVVSVDDIHKWLGQVLGK